ncbi:MAG: hypothetical protein AAF182_01085 [Pseudomonadota bacterium]
MTWNKLLSGDAEKFLETVANKEIEILFRDALCEVHECPLSFYDGYSLFRVVNKFMIPHFFMDYISNGEDHHYLDGSDIPFQNLNARGALSLGEDNVAQYLDMYISYVYERGSSFEFDNFNEGARTAFVEKRGNNYTLSAALVYQDSTHEGEVHISEGGVIDVKTPTDVLFLTSPKMQEEPGYLHPRGEDVIEEIKTLLSVTDKGQAFLKIIEDNKITFKVLNSPEYQGLSVDSKTIYITMPSVERSAKYTQAIIASCHVHDCLQQKEEFVRPHPEVDKELYLSLNYTKNLDMLLEVSIMVEELENANKPEAVKAFRDMGFGPLYDSQKGQENALPLMDVYMDIIKAMR